MHLNHSLLPNRDSRVSSLQTGDFFLAKAPGRWVGALWRSMYPCSGFATASGCIFRPVTNGVGFLLSSNPRVHIGSGTETRAASIDIRWPSGMVQSVTDVAADQFLKIEGHPK